MAKRWDTIPSEIRWKCINALENDRKIRRIPTIDYVMLLAFKQSNKAVAQFALSDTPSSISAVCSQNAVNGDLFRC